jgi:hypothetical protein
LTLKLDDFSISFILIECFIRDDDEKKKLRGKIVGEASPIHARIAGE